MTTAHERITTRKIATRAAGRRASGAASLFGLVLTALLPKCPLCVAAVLGAAGVGTAGAALLAPLVRPVAWILTGVAVYVFAWMAGRNRRSAIIGPPPGCCSR